MRYRVGLDHAIFIGSFLNNHNLSTMLKRSALTYKGKPSQMRKSPFCAKLGSPISHSKKEGPGKLIYIL